MNKKTTKNRKVLLTWKLSRHRNLVENRRLSREPLFLLLLRSNKMEEEQNHLLRLASQKEKIDEELARIDEEIQQLENQLQKPEVEPPKGFE